MPAIYIRVAQLYLDFAEAANEAYGPETKVPGTDMSAVDAINIIRNRVGAVPVRNEYKANKEIFRERIRNERAVELCFEDHRWYDIRRWMIAEDLFKGEYPIMGVKATPINHSYTADQLKVEKACTYKLTDFTYEYVPVRTAVRTFNKRNYWYPLPMDEVAALDNLQQNPGW